MLVRMQKEPLLEYMVAVQHKATIDCTSFLQVANFALFASKTEKGGKSS